MCLIRSTRASLHPKTINFDVVYFRDCCFKEVTSFFCCSVYRKGTSIRQAPVFRHLRALRKSPWKFIIWMNELFIACCWLPTSSNILILPSQFWQIRFKSCWLHCSKCRILVLLRYRKPGWLWTSKEKNIFYFIISYCLGFPRLFSYILLRQCINIINDYNLLV